MPHALLASHRLTLLRRHVTQEGESYFRRDDVAQLVDQADQPATMSGIHTVAHAIDEASPLRELYASGALQKLEGLLIHAVVQAFDNVYGGDLSATHTYGKGSLLEGAFADMIRSEGGRTTIDWDAFNATRPLGSPVRDADPEPSEPQPGRPYISCGFARAPRTARPIRSTAARRGRRSSRIVPTRRACVCYWPRAVLTSPW